MDLNESLVSYLVNPVILSHNKDDLGLEKDIRVFEKFAVSQITKLITEITASGEAQQDLNIYDLKGVGKEVWNNIDAQEYVNSERASWE